MWVSCDINFDCLRVALVVMPAIEAYLTDVGVRVVYVVEVDCDGLGYAWSTVPDELYLGGVTVSMGERI